MTTDEQVAHLLSAIRKHRDARGDDRCWLDDEELYKALPEGYTPPERDTTVELKLCQKYIECRHNPATEYVSPQRRIEELETLLKKVLESCYLPCGQTIQCAECGAVLWNVLEGVDENWHAPGCGIFAAFLATGQAKDVRRSKTVPKVCNPWGQRADMERESNEDINLAYQSAINKNRKLELQLHYEGVVPTIIEVARSCGYAIALHGSFQRDADLIACPWTCNAVSAEELVTCLVSQCGLRIKTEEERVEGRERPGSPKPHNRRAWSLQCSQEGRYFDLSVMPRVDDGTRLYVNQHEVECAEVRASDAAKKIVQLEKWIADLQSGMYVNCVYCGHRYGPKEGTPTSMADVLKAHVEECPQHPMSKLKRDIEAALAEVNLLNPTDVQFTNVVAAAAWLRLKYTELEDRIKEVGTK